MNSFIAYYVFDHLYCLINAYSSYFYLLCIFRTNSCSAVFVYVELVSCSLVREPVSEYKMAAS